MSKAVQLNHPIEAMQFRLVYDGPLRGNQHNSSEQKQDIRRKMHSQLKELWETHPALHDAGIWVDNPSIENCFECKRLGQFRFFPLVTSAHFMTCHLDLLILRRCKPTTVLYHGGDLDNRVKTFLDALRAPQQASEIPATDMPRSGEDPFFCLMEDDGLITGLALKADRLLLKSDEKAHENDVRIVVDVSIRVSHLRGLNSLFVGD